MIAALSRVMDDLIGPFPRGGKLSLGRVSGCRGNLTQDMVSYVKSSELHFLVIVLGHLLLVLCHLIRGFLSHFVQTVQVDSQVIVIVFFVEYLSPDAGYPYLDWDHCFSAIGEFEGGFSCWGSCYDFVGPQGVGQFFRLVTLRVVQLSFDNLKQCSIRHLRLSIRL